MEIGKTLFLRCNKCKKNMPLQKPQNDEKIYKCPECGFSVTATITPVHQV